MESLYCTNMKEKNVMFEFKFCLELTVHLALKLPHNGNVWWIAELIVGKKVW